MNTILKIVIQVQIEHIQMQENNKNTTTKRKSFEHLKLSFMICDCLLQYTLWKQTIEKIAVEDAFIMSYQKRLVELQKRRKDDLVLYNVIRGHHNKLIRLTDVSILVFKFASWIQFVHLQYNLKFKIFIIYIYRSSRCTNK